MVNNARHIDRKASRRAAERHRVMVPGRVTWRDSRGMTRFASVVTRDVSESGVYLECCGADAIPLFRLVYLQLERGTREVAGLPPPLRDGRVLSAVYRVGPCEPTTGTPSGYALRLLVEPAHRQTVPGRAVLDTLHLQRVHVYEPADLALDLAGPDRDGLSVSDTADLAGVESLVV